MIAAGAYRTPAEKIEECTSNDPYIAWQGETACGVRLRVVKRWNATSIEVSNDDDAMGVPIWLPFNPLQFLVVGYESDVINDKSRELMDIITTFADAVSR